MGVMLSQNGMKMFEIICRHGGGWMDMHTLCSRTQFMAARERRTMLDRLVADVKVWRKVEPTTSKPRTLVKAVDPSWHLAHEFAGIDKWDLAAERALIVRWLRAASNDTMFEDIAAATADMIECGDHVRWAQKV